MLQHIEYFFLSMTSMVCKVWGGGEEGKRNGLKTHHSEKRYRASKV